MLSDPRSLSMQSGKSVTEIDCRSEARPTMQSSVSVVTIVPSANNDDTASAIVFLCVRWVDLAWRTPVDADELS